MIIEKAIEALRAAGIPVTQAYLLIPIDTLPRGNEAAPEPAHQVGLDLGERAKIERLVRSLEKMPPHEGRTAVLERLLASAEGEWIAIQSIARPLEEMNLDKGGDATSQIASTFTQTSWYIRETMLPSDLVGTKSPNDILVEKRRYNGETQYKLTDSGRKALEIYL